MLGLESFNGLSGKVAEISGNKLCGVDCGVFGEHLLEGFYFLVSLAKAH